MVVIKDGKTGDGKLPGCLVADAGSDCPAMKKALYEGSLTASSPHYCAKPALYCGFTDDVKKQVAYANGEERELLNAQVKNAATLTLLYQENSPINRPLLRISTPLSTSRAGKRAVTRPWREAEKNCRRF